MNKISSIDSIVTSIAEIRNLRNGFITNFFLDYSKHKVWMNHHALYTEKIGDTLFLIKKNDTFWNVFFASISPEELNQAYSNLEERYPDVTMIVDIVGRKNECVHTVSVLNGLLPYKYCQLVRMSRILYPDNVCKLSEEVSYATLEQVEEVYSYLNVFFDEKTEQIPYIEELRDYADKQHILIYMKGLRIAGFVVFEKSKMLLYLRYWFVHPDFRKQGIGSKLLHQFFYEGRETKRNQLWVICSNENAIKRYIHYGFKEENLYDFVITNKNKKYEGENN